MDKTELAGNGDGRAIMTASPTESVRARTSSRRKAGAETRTRIAKIIDPLSPRISSAVKRKGQASTLSSPILGMPAQSFQPGDQVRADIQRALVADPIDELREQWRRRQMWHRAEKSLTLQAKSMCRRLLAGDKTEAEVLYKSALNGGTHDLAATAYLAMHPLLEARKGIEQARKVVEKRLLVLAKELPVAAWIEGTRGVGLLSLAGIVGEAGDLSAYSNPAKLWKRMGLAVIGGERQRKVEGAKGIEHGYNPARRSLMWTIGDCIVKAGGPLKELYNERKAYETPRVKTKMHAHNRAKRYIEKRLLRDLWRAWRDAMLFLSTSDQAHPSELQ